MGKVSTVDARKYFSDVINRAAYGKERVVLTRRGRDLAAVISVDDLRVLEELDERAGVDEAIAALTKAKTRGAVSLEEVKKKLGLD